jgi:hypothetical protein
MLLITKIIYIDLDSKERDNLIYNDTLETDIAAS